ncbi:MAG TPA: S-adenosylmethionine decarboxylase [Dehalococcoidia bacterium]|nr:S-adenosylmethionine decarboxylase [Dehalococcoidia bacterium]
MHLIIDGYTSNKQILQDEMFLRQALFDIPDLVHMTRITEPFIFRYVGDKPQDWGYSGFVFIAESHISFHTFVEQNYMNIDVFSCLDFDTDNAIEQITQKFELEKYKTYLVNRDWNPEDQAEVAQVNMLKIR